MSQKVITPNLEFTKAVIAAGGESLKKCYQCATCSVVCNLTPEDKPFPRKEMVQAQWGQKEELFANPDIWLCHQCSDCTAYCPRGAKPGEVLGAIRKMSLEEYSTPGFMAKIVNDPKFFLPLLAVPIAIYIIILSIIGHLDFSKVYTHADNPEHAYLPEAMSYSAFLNPTKNIDPVFVPFFFLSAFVLYLGITRYWGDMVAKNGEPKGKLVDGILSTVEEILFHSRFRKCDVTDGRSTSHLMVFYSFIGLAITTATAVYFVYVLRKYSPYPLADPMKILGNVSALALLIGIGLVFMNRMNNAEKAGKGSYYDWLFIGVVAAVCVTGIGAELFRLATMPSLGYPTYVIHLAFVFFLIAYAPYSKMAHMVYRATAMVYANMMERK